MTASNPDAAQAEEQRGGQTMMKWYWGGRWHYPEGLDEIDVIAHALTFALQDYERWNDAGRAHPYTLGPAAIKDALDALQRIAEGATA